MSGLIYLATPYTHPDPEVRAARYRAACREVGDCWRRGIFAHSPIAHSHTAAIECNLPHDWEFWREYDRRILEMCECLIVVQLPGWQESKGVTAEIELAHELGKDVLYAIPSMPLEDILLREIAR